MSNRVWDAELGWHDGPEVGIELDDKGRIVETWPEEDRVKMRRNAQAMFTDEYHASGGCRRDGVLGRSNCGPCVLGGYEPRGEDRDPEWDVKRDGPNYAGWGRLYVEAGYPMKKAWRDAFERDQLGSDNEAYAAALRKSVATFGARFA